MSPAEECSPPSSPSGPESAAWRSRCPSCRVLRILGDQSDVSKTGWPSNCSSAELTWLCRLRGSQMSVRSAKLLATNLFGRRRRAAPMKYHRSVRPDGRSARAPGRRPSVAVAAGKDSNKRDRVPYRGLPPAGARADRVDRREPLLVLFVLRVRGERAFLCAREVSVSPSPCVGNRSAAAYDQLLRGCSTCPEWSSLN